MKKYYIYPCTEFVHFDCGDTMKFSDITDASCPGGPGSSAPARSGAMRNTLIEA